jgi:hypothetical protein
VWNLDRQTVGLTRQPITLPVEQVQPRTFWSLIAALEKPLHAETNPKQRPSGIDVITYAGDPLGCKRLGCSKVADARDDDRAGASQLGGLVRYKQVGANGGEGLLYRGQISGAVIDQCNSHPS